MRRTDSEEGHVTEERLLDDHELSELELAHSEGLTAAQVVDLFAARGVRLSEATFRKYVQLGLVPRSRRVGRKGKNRGSMGLYPATALRRINEIRRRMADGFTIEDIQRSFLRFRDEIDGVARGLEHIFDGFERELRSPEVEPTRRKTLSRELVETRRLADELVGRIEQLERQVLSPLERAARARAFSSGASGGAGDLL